MPEGDTIHRAAAQLRKALDGATIERCEIRRALHGTVPPAAGTTIESVKALGKHLLICFDDGRELHTHMGMTGSWHVYGPRERWRKPQHLARVIITTTQGTSAVCFNAPLVELRDGRTARTRPTSRAQRSLDALGPDLTERDVALDVVVGRARAAANETELGVLLLDQRVASGIGNAIKSEACWVERMNPFTAVGEIDSDALAAVYQRAHELLVASVATGRRTTVDGQLAVYGRAGRMCLRCRTPIRMQRQGDDARSTYWCPHCQPAIRDGSVDAPTGA